MNTQLKLKLSYSLVYFLRFLLFSLFSCFANSVDCKQVIILETFHNFFYIHIFMFTIKNSNSSIKLIQLLKDMFTTNGKHHQIFCNIYIPKKIVKIIITIVHKLNEF